MNGYRAYANLPDLGTSLESRIEITPIARVLDGVIDEIERSVEQDELKRLVGIPIVYLIVNRRAGLWKIGYTTNIAQRLSSLSAACGVQLELLAWFEDTPNPERMQRLEKRLHQDFDQFRQRGEWFEPHTTIAATFGVQRWPIFED